MGYEMYCKILEEVIKEERGVGVGDLDNPPEIEITIDIDVSSYIPDGFIDNDSGKIEIYQNIALCKTEEDIENVIDEILDRFGTMPKEVENLLDIARIKNLCRKLGIIKVMQKRQSIVFNFNNSLFNIDIVDKLVKEYKNKIMFSPSAEPYLIYKIDDTEKVLNEIKTFLENF